MIEVAVKDIHPYMAVVFEGVGRSQHKNSPGGRRGGTSLMSTWVICVLESGVRYELCTSKKINELHDINLTNRRQSIIYLLKLLIYMN
jgi:hypothetical protein